MSEKLTRSQRQVVAEEAQAEALYRAQLTRVAKDAADAETARVEQMDAADDLDRAIDAFEQRPDAHPAMVWLARLWHRVGW
jgi:hypothetical protein